MSAFRLFTVWNATVCDCHLAFLLLRITNVLVVQNSEEVLVCNYSAAYSTLDTDFSLIFRSIIPKNCTQYFAEAKFYEGRDDRSTIKSDYLWSVERKNRQ